MITKSTFCFLLLMCLAGFVQAQVPGTLSYQGILVQSDGSAIGDGTHSIAFNFYTASTGGSATLTRTVSVTTSKGLYTCIIGDGTAGNLALPASVGTQQLYIGIRVDGGTELLPRAQLTTSAYAFQAQSAYSIDAAGITGTITTAGKVSGNAITSGTIGGSTVVNTTGTITGSSFTYTSSKTKHLSFNSTAFTVVVDASGNPKTAQYLLNAGGSDWIRFANGIALMPVDLPNGATITSLSFFSGSCDGSDGCNSVIGGQVVVRLKRQLNNSSSLMATATAAAQTSGTFSTSAITNAVIDNAIYSYQLSVEITGGINSPADFYSGLITYTVASPN